MARTLVGDSRDALRCAGSRAGELVGGHFFHNYPGGSGLTVGAVWGRRAGRAAAETALSA
jgi:sugar/nucleoside kinase (ribokinase family)